MDQTVATLLPSALPQSAGVVAVIGLHLTPEVLVVVVELVELELLGLLVKVTLEVMVRLALNLPAVVAAVKVRQDLTLLVQQ
jgi:hypothetical protein